MKLGDGRNELAGRFIRVVIHNIAIFENKTAVEVENELAAQVNLSYASMQKYKSGYPITDNRLIKIIVENGVKRGMVTYEWAKKFLDYSYYPETKALLDELFPSKTAVDRPIIANNNLPSPSYSKFVMRQGYFDDIGTKLSCRSSVLLIISLGGMGKTSIVREIASECISPVVRYQTVPRFHAAVWISDREKPGQTNITTVLDEIASTLGYDGVAKLAFDEKNSEVMRLLKTTKTLLILDNFDTVRDDSLIEWLINLPEPSKCIVATREYHRLFRNNTTVIELKGMNEFEARDFIDNRMRALGLSTSVIADDRFLSVLKATGGNPKAMEMVVGQIRHGSSLDTILEDLSNAKGDIFTDLFSRAWNLLNEDEKQTLMLMSMFPGGTVRSALPELLCLNSTQLESAVTKLSELSLISIENEAPLDDPFYSLHPLVHSFAAQILSVDSYAEKNLRKRWLEYYLSISSRIGFCWNDIDKLKLLDKKGLREGIEYSIQWAYENHNFDFIITVSENVKYYFYIRGFWSSPLNRIRADVANKLGLYQIQFDALVYQFNILCKQENMKEADKYLTEIADLVAKNNFSESSLINFTHAKALYYLAKKEYDKAIRLWRVNLKKSTLDEHQLNANRRWLGICYFKRGRAGDLERASDILRNLTDDVMGKGLIHSALSTSVYLAKIDFKKLDFDAANAKIEAALLIADKFYDRAALAELLLLKGDYLLRTKDLENATKILTTAMTHFERLGKSNRVNEIESMLLNVKPKKEVK